MEEPPGTERNNCHCESSGPFMGRIKVNGKPCSGSLPLSEKRLVKDTEGEKRRGTRQDSARRGPGGRRDASRLQTGGGEPHSSPA